MDPTLFTRSGYILASNSLSNMSYVSFGPNGPDKSHGLSYIYLTIGSSPGPLVLKSLQEFNSTELVLKSKTLVKVNQIE